MSSLLVLDEDGERATRRRRVDAVLSASIHSVTSGVGSMGPGSIRSGSLSLGPQDAISISSFASSTNSRRKRAGDALTDQKERLKRLRSASPVISETSSMESRGLFVRPTQVLLVMDATDH
jgi:hypothetical protein